MVGRSLSRREMAVLCGSLAVGFVLCGLLSFGFGWGQAQLDTGAALCTDTLRLHIRADSDRLLDQSAKLAVRDAILAYMDAHCPVSSGDKPAALRWAAQNLPVLELTARQTLAALSLPPAARVELVNMYFSTTRYTDAALPAGRYDALRIELGANARTGKNWWCVLYPGLCRTACGGYALPEENDLICGEHLVRFRLVEWVQAHTEPRADRTLLTLGA